MSGDRFDSSGQLALMDAMVFFVAAVIVSSTLLSHMPSHQNGSSWRSVAGDADPSELLNVFLACSVGELVVIDGERDMFLDDRTTTSEALSIELNAIEAGHDISEFESLNDLLARILRDICNPAFDPFIVVIDVNESSSESILSIPSEPGKSARIYASSTEIPGASGDIYLVELLLRPALLPESV